MSSAFSRIIIISNESSGWVASACALSWARSDLTNAKIIIVDHASRIDVAHTLISMEEVHSAQSDLLAKLRSPTESIPGMFLTLCADTATSGLSQRVSFLTNLPFPAERPPFVPDFQNDLFVYVSACGEAGDPDHAALGGLRSLRGAGTLLLLADRAARRSAWAAAGRVPGWRRLACAVAEFGPPSVDPPLTRAFVRRGGGRRGAMESVALGVALGVVKSLPLRFRSPFAVVPVDVAALTALAASMLLVSGEVTIPFADVQEKDGSMSFCIPSNALVWGMFAEYLLDYYGRFSEESTGVLPKPHLLDPLPTLQLRSNLSDWVNYGLSLMKPLHGYYNYSANNRRKCLLSYFPASQAASRIAVAIANVDKTVQRVVAEAEEKWPEDDTGEFYTKLLETMGKSYHLQPLLNNITMFSVRWDIYVKTIAQAVVERFISGFIDVPVHLLPLKSFYNNDIVFSGERRAPPTLLTPRRYFTDLHWMRFFGMNSNGIRMATAPGLTKDREELILQQNSVKLVLDKIKEEEKVSDEDLRQQSRAILRTIGDTLNQYHVRIFGFMVRKIFFQLYEEVSLNEEAFDRLYRAFETPRTQVVLVPAHRSYMDFLILTYILTVMGFSPPHICAGDDFLRMGPITTLMRGSGGFFMRRSFRDDQLYYTLFKEYVRQLVYHQQVLEFFIEGTRSRSGKMLSPKIGILKFITDAFFENQNMLDDIYFVPVSLSYDEILEAGLYANEELGTSKPKESIGNLFRARSLLKKKHGSIHVLVGEPLSLRQFRDTPHMCPAPLKSLGATFAQEKDSVNSASNKTPLHMLRNLAWHICYKIEENTVVTSTALLAMILSTMPPKSVISIKEAERRMVWLQSHMARRKIPLSPECTCAKSSELTQRAVLHLSRFIHMASPDSISVSPNMDSLMALSTCSNQLIHVFLDEAIIAAVACARGEVDEKSYALRVQKAALKEDCQKLHKLLASEFPRYLPWCPYTFDSWFDHALSRLFKLGKDDGDYENLMRSVTADNSVPRHSTNTSDVCSVSFITLPMNALFQFIIRMISPFVEVLYFVSLGAFVVAESGETVLQKNALLAAFHAFGFSLHNAGDVFVFPQMCNKRTLKHALESIANFANLKSDVTSSEPLYVPRGEMASSVLLTQIEPVLKYLRSLYTKVMAKAAHRDEPMACRTLLELYQKQLTEKKTVSKI